MTNPPATVWINGELIPADRATVSVYDRGFTSGDGVFETVKVVHGVPFAITRHLRRLAESAHIIGFAPPPDAHLREAVAATVDANLARLGDLGRLRVTLTAGRPQGSGSVPTRGGSDLTLVLTADPQTPHPGELKVVSVPWPHNERGPLVGAKTTSYADNLAVLEQVRQKGADEALISDTQGRICEATTANVLLGVKGKLVTPTLRTGCLGGVTRSLLIEWGIVSEQDVEFSELGWVSEMLLSSSTRNLVPVARCDDHIYPSPGPLGSEAIKEFAVRSAQDLDP